MYPVENHLFRFLLATLWRLTPGFLLFIHFKIQLMSVLVQRWLVGGVWVSCWFVSPGLFVFASRLGYCFSSSCSPPL